MKLFTTIKSQLITAVTVIGAGIALYGYAEGWYQSFSESAVNSIEQAKTDSILTIVANEWIESRNNLPISQKSILRVYLENENEEDSSDFILQQVTNIIFSNAFAGGKMVLDSHGCEYWFNMDPSGGLWWRDRVKGIHGEIIKTYPYSVRYNNTNGSFEYTDYQGRVRKFKHDWED